MTKGKKVKVYIAGALSPKQDTSRNPSRVVTDYIQNLNRMCEAAAELRMLGYYPYVPGLDFMLGLVDGDWEEDDYREIGIAFLEVCDCLCLLSESWGVIQEVALARQLNIPVYYGIESFMRTREENE